MILTRCPECGTTFRVHREQLQARGGLVRCGRCHAAFDGLAHLLDNGPALPAVAAPAQVSAAPPTEASSSSPTGPAAAGNEAPGAAGDIDDFELLPAPPGDPVAPTETPPEVEDLEPLRDEPTFDEAALDEFLVDAGHVNEPTLRKSEPPVPADKPPRAEATAGTDAARVAGLLAPRDTTEIAGYSKWHQGALAAEPARPLRWPFVVAAILLALALAAQSAFAFRTTIATALPRLGPAYAALGIAVPLPRQSESISIEASELQTDSAHGNLLALQATVKNRAGFALEYPHLELTLTDTQDGAIARRVFAPADYLPVGKPPAAGIEGHGEVAIKLWLDTHDIVAAGYRLYVFYP